MTDTRLFRTIAFRSKQGLVKVFWGFNHHRRAAEWAALPALEGC